MKGWPNNNFDPFVQAIFRQIGVGRGLGIQSCPDSAGDDDGLDETKAIAKFAGSNKALKQEFRDQETYLAYLKAAQSGMVNVLNHK